jgi:hypothetical protein
MNTEEFTDYLLILRGVEKEDCCNKCSGLGTAVYGSTSTWRGGVGGLAMTSSVCDKCWGSGSIARPWPSWRAQQSKDRQFELAQKRIKELEAKISEFMGAGEKPE